MLRRFGGSVPAEDPHGRPPRNGLHVARDKGETHPGRSLEPHAMQKKVPGLDGKDPRIANPVLNRLVSCQNMNTGPMGEELQKIASGYVSPCSGRDRSKRLLGLHLKLQFRQSDQGPRNPATGHTGNQHNRSIRPQRRCFALRCRQQATCTLNWRSSGVQRPCWSSIT